MSSSLTLPARLGVPVPLSTCILTSDLGVEGAEDSAEGLASAEDEAEEGFSSGDFFEPSGEEGAFF